VVPKAIREAAGLVAGTRLEVRLEGGRVELEPLPIEVKIERREGLVVAVPAEPTEPLTGTAVRRTRDKVRRGEA